MDVSPFIRYLITYFSQDCVCHYLASLVSALRPPSSDAAAKEPLAWYLDENHSVRSAYNSFGKGIIARDYMYM